MSESQLRALFAQVAASEPAGSRVDAQRARRRGRARLRWRRACVAGGSVLAAAAVTALAVGVGPARPGPGPAAAGPAAPRQFSPLVPYASFGWLPAGVSLVSGGIRPTASYMDAGPRGDPEWTLAVYARGQCHLTRSASGLNCPGSLTLPIRQRAPDVAGHRAFWYSPGLVWQYARGGWAVLGIPAPNLSTVLHSKELAGQALKIARNVRYGVPTRFVFLAQFSRLPSHWQVHNISYYVPDSGLLRADEYMLTTGGSHFHPRVGDTGVWTDAPYIIVHPAPRKGTCSPQDRGSKRTIIDGYRVVLKHYHIGGLPVQELCGAHADGLWFDIQVFGTHPSIHVVSLFRDHMRLLGTSPANWTSQPIG